MTEQNITEAPEVDLENAPEETTEPTVEQTTEEPQTEESKPGNSEAAKWRVKFREAEGTITSLQARLDNAHAAEVARLATGPGRLHDGGDLLLTTQLADLLDDEGNVSAELVAEKVSALVEKKPHLAKPAFEDGIGIGEKSPASEITWADVIGG